MSVELVEGDGQMKRSRTTSGVAQPGVSDNHVIFLGIE